MADDILYLLDNATDGECSLFEPAAKEIRRLRAQVSSHVIINLSRISGLEHGNRSLRKGLERMRRRVERAEMRARMVVRPALSTLEIMALRRAINACEITREWAEKQPDDRFKDTVAVCKTDADAFKGLLERNSKGGEVPNG
jgi:hypothetical protein